MAIVIKLGEIPSVKVELKDVAINPSRPEQSKTATPTAEGVTVIPDEGYALSTVVVNGDAELTPENVKKSVEIFGVTGVYDPQPNLQTAERSYTANGDYAITPDAQHDGISEAAVHIAVPNPSSGTLAITENGTYNVASKALARVNVPKDARSEILPYLTEEYHENEAYAWRVVLYGFTVIQNSQFYHRWPVSLSSFSFVNIGAKSLTSIGGSAFNSLGVVDSITFPNSLRTIENGAFFSASIPIIRFEGTPNTIGAYAFYEGVSIREIYVPWAEGAVAGAPWGATYAMIVYNYTGA